MIGVFCEVYLLDLPYHIDRPFDYISDGSVSVGDVVRVPFGKGGALRTGIVSVVKDKLDNADVGIDKIKPVHSVLSDTYKLSDGMLGLCFFLKSHTLCTFGEAARAVLPPGAFSGSEGIKTQKRISLNLSPEEAAFLLTQSGRAAIRSEGQREIIRYLSATGSADRELVLALPGVTPSHITALKEKGVITVSESELIRNPYSSLAKDRDTSAIELSAAQQTAHLKITELYEENKPRCALLFGVTGSGKTKVIMKSIDRTIADGKSVIMLVPEIALTPQTVGIFCKRYGERVAVIHSSLSRGERLDAWRRIKRGEVDLVIGTRSAIFAPLSNIGLIVIDEEHEHTYKSESDPKYHAREVAAYRCKEHSSLLLLASATPSLESFYKAKSGVYTLVPLRERYGGARLPRAVVVDMREELKLGNTSAISQRLFNSLREVKEAGKQAILFLNRRGFSSQISCKKCGEVISCPRCSVSLTHHTDRYGGRLLCHLCGYSSPVPRNCPSCSEDNLSFLGFGTQKLESELERFLPDTTLMRMDADTTSGKLSYDRMLEDFRTGRADILLGTQMVAKGHDFPNVTLVGVALADTSLYVSDFRAAERTFSLLTQVIGRAGRAGGDGVAVIQTFSPKNETLRLACKQDYESFYEGEIALRRELSYPPFCDMVSLMLTSSSESVLRRGAERLSRAVITRLEGEYKNLPFTVYGPHEAAVYKLNDKYRMKMVLKCRLNSMTRRLFHELLCEFSPERDFTLSIDLNTLE